MTDKKSVLVIGLQPTLIDFSDPDYAAFPGLDAAKVIAGLQAAADSLTQLGYDVRMANFVSPTIQFRQALRD